MGGGGGGGGSSVLRAKGEHDQMNNRCGFHAIVRGWLKGLG